MIVRPVIVLGAPRSGTTILQRCLILHPELWHLPAESHAILEGPFHPAARNYESNRVLGEEVSPQIRARLLGEFDRQAVNLNRILRNPGPLLNGDGMAGRSRYRGSVATLGRLAKLGRPSAIRLCEKTPKNSLRVPMLERLFPDASYLWIQRSAEENIASLAAGWKANERARGLHRRRFTSAGYPIAEQLRLRDYADRWWKFALVPGWRSLAGRTIADVAAWQWYQCNRFTLSDLQAVDPNRVHVVGYDTLVTEPRETVGRILRWAGLAPSGVVEAFTRRLPRINSSRPTASDADRSRRHRSVAEAIEQLAAAHPFHDLKREMADVAERHARAAA